MNQFNNTEIITLRHGQQLIINVPESNEKLQNENAELKLKLAEKIHELINAKNIFAKEIEEMKEKYESVKNEMEKYKFFHDNINNLKEDVIEEKGITSSSKQKEKEEILDTLKDINYIESENWKKETNNYIEQYLVSFSKKKPVEILFDLRKIHSSIKSDLPKKSTISNKEWNQYSNSVRNDITWFKGDAYALAHKAYYDDIISNEYKFGDCNSIDKYIKDITNENIETMLEKIKKAKIKEFIYEGCLCDVKKYKKKLKNKLLSLSLPLSYLDLIYTPFDNMEDLFYDGRTKITEHFDKSYKKYLFVSIKRKLQISEDYYRSNDASNDPEYKYILNIILALFPLKDILYHIFVKESGLNNTIYVNKVYYYMHGKDPEDKRYWVKDSYLIDYITQMCVEIKIRLEKIAESLQNCKDESILENECECIKNNYTFICNVNNVVDYVTDLVKTHNKYTPTNRDYFDDTTSSGKKVNIINLNQDKLNIIDGMFE